jgi:hypothetical protein
MVKRDTTRPISLSSGRRELRGYFEWVASVVARARHHNMNIPTTAAELRGWNAECDWGVAGHDCMENLSQEDGGSRSMMMVESLSHDASREGS